MREEAIFAGGCFWCLEAYFQRVRGVLCVRSGYTGGAATAPSYRQVCSGVTGHAEAVRIAFDPEKIGYAELLRLFFAMHDPTTRDRQGADVGTQYRSAIFYVDEKQKAAAEAAIVEAQGKWTAPIVTELRAAGAFYEAEPYHADYYDLHADEPYCRLVIAPKLAHLPEEVREPEPAVWRAYSPEDGAAGKKHI